MMTRKAMEARRPWSLTLFSYSEKGNNDMVSAWAGRDGKPDAGGPECRKKGTVNGVEGRKGAGN